MKKVWSFLLAGALACSAGTVNKKISSDLANSTSQQSAVQVIVQWNIDTGATTTQKITALGGVVVSEFPRLHEGVYNLPQSALASLGADANVKFVSADRKVVKKAATVQVARVAATVNAPSVWNRGFNGYGVGVAVIDSGMNQDDDLSLYSNVPVYTEDFTGLIPGKNAGPKNSGYGPDWYGHGQHIAGIIASNGKSSICPNCTQSFIGIAPGVKLINLKVLDANGTGSDSSVIAALDRAIALKSSYNIRVINLSLGRPVFESYTQDPLCQAVEAAWQSGIVVVVAAGNNGRDNSFANEGYGTINAPGNDPYVLTVGSMRDMGTPTRSDDLVASYSSKGPTVVDHIVKPDVVAPGNRIVSLLAQNGTLGLNDPENVPTLATFQSNAPKAGNIPVQGTYDTTSNTQPPAVKVGPGYSNNYYVMSGTSMAAAVVSGAVADLLQAAPALTPDQVKMLLMQTASKAFPSTSNVVDSVTGQIYTSYYDIFTVGAGYIDMQAALSSINQVPTGLTALSPTANYDATSGDVELSFDPSSVFSDKAMWGAGTVASNKAMWGAGSVWSSSVLAGSKAMWGASSIWGASSDSTASKAMWGAGAIWSSKAIWGASNMNASESIAIAGEQ